MYIGYSTIETKEVDRIQGRIQDIKLGGGAPKKNCAERIGYNGFRFPHEYSGDGLGATVT